MTSYHSRVAIVTGGGSGIGLALCQQLAERGATVIVSDIDGDSAVAAADHINRSGNRATAATVDVTDAAAVQELVDDTARKHGHIDLMFNNAGIALVGEVLDMELGDWYRVLDINLRGVIHGVHAVYPIMVRQRSGHIVNIASIAGLIAAPSLTAYATTKHAVVGLSRSLRAEACAHDVRVSVVCPGFIDTPIADNAKVIAIDRNKAAESLPFKLMSAQNCARHILRGVDKNKPEIVVTLHAHVMYRAQRLFPALASHAAARQMKRIRATKTSGDE